MPADPDAERVLADVGAELADRVASVVPAWVVRCVEGLFDAWCAARERGPVGAVPSAAHDVAAQRTAVMAEAEKAGRIAGEEVGARLRQLLLADVDAQRATPLQLVRQAIVYPSEVLRAAGVPPVARDRFTTERFPDDDYGLTPASLGAVDPSLGELAVVWGAAKAAAHRRRHS